MAQHAILRFEKHKGNPARPLEAHHERQKEQYASNPDIDTSRSKYNFHIVKPEGRYYHFIQNRIEQAGCRTRKDSTRFVDTLITASPEFFKKKSPKEIQEFFQRAADFLIGRVGKENIVSAVVHMDEKTPHLHLTFVPLTKDNRLCAKEIIGNRANLTKWQDDFHAYMVEKYPDLERGESASKTGRKHIPTRLFKQAVSLSKQARAIEAALDGINPLNAGKKKEEALSMLKKWFPQMENFSGQLKKYKVTINDLLAENEQLEARAILEERGEKPEQRAECAADLAVSANIPESYVPSQEQRMDLYRRIALVRTEAEADDLMDEVIDRFGDPPPSVYTLVQVALLRADAGKVGVTDISQKNGCLKFLLAQFDMQKVSALYARPEFKGRLKVDAGAKPGVILRLKTRTHVIEQARAFVSAWADAQGDRA